MQVLNLGCDEGVLRRLITQSRPNQGTPHRVDMEVGVVEEGVTAVGAGGADHLEGVEAATAGMGEITSRSPAASLSASAEKS